MAKVSDEADNLVLRHLEKLRADMGTGFEKVATKGDLGTLRSEVSDLRRDVSEGFAAVTKALTALARRLDDVDTGIRLADRLTAIEKRLSDLERSRGS